ncbi:hypothetical protein [Cellulomonas xiejunii]|uniref:Uncharacterized protein n=1 Tax=Cellulomonas xiejunii TaxID=2968083 RepID=A0ABY5KLN1_9CELL|nr:hypothetical protein [Cellulomonas xiejunii]MCC2312791.1 hypothetical protein [Cellulomonas xiejunii]MCC2320337.1 hypothetical protein [Cellulomonas xiejunii]UUI70638.1 hypothetical protein NP048_12630 [Cellulomonas xiejunii]
MRRSPALPVLAATVVALVLAGCSGDGTSSASDDEIGPLSAFFEKVGGSYEEDDAAKQQREMDEIIAACMAEQGFEYTADESMTMGMAADEDMPEWNSKEYAEEYGYGATTSGGMDDGEEWVDPNADYLATMSEGEQAAFYEALYGAEPEVDPDADPDAAVEYNWEDGGCSGKASHEVYEQGQLWEDPAFEAMFEEMNTVYEERLDDPAVRKALTEWSSCMAEAGYDFEDPQAAQNSIYDEMSALWEAPADPEAELDPEASFEVDEAALEELKKKELALAPVDFACKEASGYEEAEKVAQLALEKRLWEKYGDQLEAAAAKHTPAK